MLRFGRWFWSRARRIKHRVLLGTGRRPACFALDATMDRAASTVKENAPVRADPLICCPDRSACIPGEARAMVRPNQEELGGCYAEAGERGVWVDFRGAGLCGGRAFGNQDWHPLCFFGTFCLHLDACLL